MICYEHRVRMTAAGLSALAGFVDSIGFIELGGFFVSFMSGNTTRFAVGLAEASETAALAIALIGVFVAGVVFGTVVGHRVRRRRPVVILAFVAFLLLIASSFASLGMTKAAIIAMTLAMGAENAIFARAGEVQIGLTYMTGTLVKFAQHLANALLGGDRLAWVPYLLLWLGFALGAIAGAFAYSAFALNSLWLAAAAAAIFALLAARLDLELKA